MRPKWVLNPKVDKIKLYIAAFLSVFWWFLEVLMLMPAFSTVPNKAFEWIMLGAGLIFFLVLGAAVTYVMFILSGIEITELLIKRDAINNKTEQPIKNPL